MKLASSDYDGVTIRSPKFPVAERIEDWWRRRWHFTLPDGGKGRIVVPPPIGVYGDVTMIVSAWPTDEGAIVETFTREEKLSAEEITHVSVIAAWLCRGVDVSLVPTIAAA
jgi:hypothetical protein